MEVDFVVYRVPMCHHQQKMLTPVPMMLQLSDILPIAHSISIHVLFFDVLISTLHCKLLLLLVDKVLVKENCSHELQFQCKVKEELCGRHYEFSNLMEASVDK